MENFRGKTAVITGAASGIGAGLARHAAGLGINLVLADINAERLEALADELGGRVRVVAQPTDVADATALQRLADISYREFGQVDLLFNNAGVLFSGYSWEISPQDWQWIININLMGVIHGLHAFVPRMLESGREGHIVNTSSLAGLISGPLMGPYTVPKQGVRALSETLHYELRSLDSRLHCSVLCPGPVATGIVRSGDDHQHASSIDSGEGQQQLMNYLDADISAGMTPDECAGIIFDAIRERRFWIFTHPEFKDEYKRRIAEVLDERNPEYQMMIIGDVEPPAGS